MPKLAIYKIFIYDCLKRKVPMNNNSLVFIPDITGFSSFVSNTALEHSKIIISSLLELLIKTNNDTLTISEIEGDAILFYKKEDIPDFEKLFKLSKEMFINFHKYLKEKSEVNDCKCEACKEAPGLTLKFILHAGELDEIKIGNFVKIHGKGVLIAHKLLKNNIDLKEYMLITEDYMKNYFVENLNNYFKVTPIKNKEFVKDVGEIETIVIPFKPLLKTI